jgi:acyl-CoA synthetase (AMP-forming)/AMP-acid ligase II
MRTQMHHLLLTSARERGEAPALTSKDVTVTYAQLWREVSGFGDALRRLGLGRRDRVAVYLDKRIETVTAIFGASAAGAVFVPVNPLLKPKQVGYIMQDCDVRVLVTSPDRYAVLREELEQCKALDHVILTGTDEETASGSGSRYAVSSWPRDLQGAPGSAVEGIDLDMAAIFYTSGSTGRPKGVVLSHRNLIVGAESVSSYLGNRPDDVILSALPLSFDAPSTG